MPEYHETECLSCETRFFKVSAIAGSQCPVCRGTITNLPRTTLALSCEWCHEMTTVEVVTEHYEEYKSGSSRLIQNIFPELSFDERELLISRTCPTCWDELFKFEYEKLCRHAAQFFIH